MTDYAAWTMTVDGHTFTDEDFTAEVGCTAAALSATALGVASWDSLNPWLSPIYASNIAAAVIASREGGDVAAVVERLKPLPLGELVPSRREIEQTSPGTGVPMEVVETPVLTGRAMVFEPNQERSMAAAREHPIPSTSRA